jgi:NAD(P)-dependent dehydrogenase (short-subunit alcohol dehydrogenase family)
VHTSFWQNPGVGKELCKILYQHNGTVYIAGRSQSKADTAIEEIKQAYPSSDGKLEFLHVDLADLPTIKKSVENFMSREQRLDVLTNSESSRALSNMPQHLQKIWTSNNMILAIKLTPSLQTPA